MNWQDFQSIIDKLGLDSTNVSKVEEQLEQLRNELHPDRTGGEFESEEDKVRYLQVVEGLRFLDDYQSRAVVPIESVVSIVQAVGKLVSPSDAEIRSARESQALHRFRDQLKSRYVLPKVTSATFSVICTAVILLQGTLHDHPLYEAVHGTVEWLVFPDQSNRLPLYYQDFFRGESPRSLWQFAVLAVDEERGWAEQIGRSIDWESPRDWDVNVFRTADSLVSAVLPDSLAYLTFDQLDNVGLYSTSDELSQSTEFRGAVALHALRDINRRVDGAQEWAASRADSIIMSILFLLLAASSFAFLRSWLRERSDERWSKYLLTQSGLTDVVASGLSKGVLDEEFSRSEFLTLISQKPVGRSAFVLGRTVDQVDMSEIASASLENLCEAGVIEVMGESSPLNPRYRVVVTRIGSDL